MVRWAATTSNAQIYTLCLPILRIPADCLEFLFHFCLGFAQHVLTDGLAGFRVAAQMLGILPLGGVQRPTSKHVLEERLSIAVPM